MNCIVSLENYSSAFGHGKIILDRLTVDEANIITMICLKYGVEIEITPYGEGVEDG